MLSIASLCFVFVVRNVSCTHHFWNVSALRQGNYYCCNQFWQSWMLLFALGVFALLQLWYLHKGLVLADPTDVVG